MMMDQIEQLVSPHEKQAVEISYGNFKPDPPTLTHLKLIRNYACALLVLSP